MSKTEYFFNLLEQKNRSIEFLPCVAIAVMDL